MAAEAGRLLQQLVGRCVRLLFDERLLAALGHVIAVNDARSATLGLQNGARGQQTSLVALMQVTAALAAVSWCVANMQHHAMWRRWLQLRAVRCICQQDNQQTVNTHASQLSWRSHPVVAD